MLINLQPLSKSASARHESSSHEGQASLSLNDGITRVDLQQFKTSRCAPTPGDNSESAGQGGSADGDGDGDRDAAGDGETETPAASLSFAHALLLL